MAVRTVKVENRTFDISYEIINREKDKDIIILHGWGSNKELMMGAFKKFMPSFRHIYIDMPGFGKSSNIYSLTTNDYYNIIEKFIKELNIKKEIIIGHSFGGKVALLLNPKILVLLSSAGIPVKKSLKTKIKIAIFKMLKPIGGENLYKLFATKDVEGMSKNMYETLKNVVDEDFTDKFKNFENEALIFWGKEDKATPLSSGEKIASLIKRSRFYPMEGDHYFFLKSSEKISKRIEEYYKK